MRNLSSAVLITIYNLFFVYQWASSQEPYMKKIGIPEGVPSINIYDLYVAKNGLLYLGTDKGLFSYDGINFKKYIFTESLAVGVNKISEDENGTIWCKNFSNQIFYTEESSLKLEEFSSKTIHKSDENLVDYALIAGGFYFATERKVYYVSKKGEQKTIFRITNEKSVETITSILFDKKLKTLYIATTSAIFKLNTTGSPEIITSTNEQTDLMFFSEQLYCLNKGQKNELFDVKSRIYKNKTSLTGRNISLSSANNKLWICSTTGVHYVNPRQQTIGPSLVTNIKATDIVNDLEGNLWISTIGEGLYFVPNENLIKLSINNEIEKKILNPNLSCLTKDEVGNIYAGTSNGYIYEINPSNKLKLTYYSGEDLEIEFIKIYDNLIYSSRGLFKKGVPQVLHQFYFGKDLMADSYGNFVVATHNNSGLLSRKFGYWPNFPDFLVGKLNSVVFGKTKEIFYSFRSKRTRAVFFDEASKSYYIGNSDGLYFYSPKHFQKEILDQNNKPIIAAQILKDRYGYIWVASIQQGIFKIDQEQVVDNLNINNGLKNNQCKKMRIDNNEIWLITDGGLQIIDVKTNKIEDVSSKAGFDALMISDIEISNGNIYLASNEGLLSVPKNRLIKKSNPIFNIVGVENGDLKISDNAILKYNENNVKFQFQTIHFRSMGNYLYEYRLLGSDPEWKSQEGKINEVNFIALPPGSYTLEARVRLADTLSPIQRFTFSIATPFWRTYWFILLLIIASGVVVYLIYSWQLNKIHTKQQIREQLALSQITAMRAQMNPHFMFNILNAFQGLIYSNQKTKANEYLGLFSDLMRKTLDISDQREITILEEIEAIELYIKLEEARFEDDTFEFNLIIDNSDELEKYVIPSLIIQPYIENAIKHGLMHKMGYKILTLSISKSNEGYWLITIEDNGIGREKSMERNQKFQKHKSFATKSIDSRIELINKLNTQPIILEIIDLKNDKGAALGTKIILKIPLKPKKNESNNS